MYRLYCFGFDIEQFEICLYYSTMADMNEIEGKCHLARTASLSNGHGWSGGAPVNNICPQNGSVVTVVILLEAAR